MVDAAAEIKLNSSTSSTSAAATGSAKETEAEKQKRLAKEANEKLTQKFGELSQGDLKKDALESFLSNSTSIDVSSTGVKDAISGFWAKLTNKKNEKTSTSGTDLQTKGNTTTKTSATKPTLGNTLTGTNTTTEVTDAEIAAALDFSDLGLESVKLKTENKTQETANVSAKNITPVMQKEATEIVAKKGNMLDEMKQIQEQLKDTSLSPEQRAALVEKATALYQSSMNLGEIQQVKGLQDIDTKDLTAANNRLRDLAGVPANTHGKENYQALADRGKLKPVDTDDIDNYPTLKKVQNSVNGTDATQN